jgi:hypothetical protein
VAIAKGKKEAVVLRVIDPAGAGGAGLATDLATLPLGWGGEGPEVRWDSERGRALLLRPAGWGGEVDQLYEDAARPFRRAVGSSWSVDETYTKIAGKPAYVYRAIDGQGQVVDVYVSQRRATADAAAFFRRAIEATGVIPDEVTTDGAARPP